MKKNSEMSGSEKFAAAINDLWRFVGVALSWLWKHGGPFLMSFVAAVGSFGVGIWQRIFDKDSDSTEIITDSQAARYKAESSATFSASESGESMTGTSTVTMFDDANDSNHSASNSIRSSASQLWGKVAPTMQKTRETAGPAMKSAWSTTQSKSQDLWTAAKPKMESMGQSIQAGSASFRAKVQEASGEGSSSGWLSRARSWLQGGLPNVLGAELLILIIGALLFWLFGRRSLYGYSWFVMVIGAVIALASMVKGYYDMNLERVEGFFTFNRDGSDTEYAVAATDSQIRYTAFAQMAFWCFIGIVAVIFGATLSSFIF